MKISQAYKSITTAMQILERIDNTDYQKRKYNQFQINKAYNILESFRDEIIREKIKKEGTKDAVHKRRC